MQRYTNTRPTPLYPDDNGEWCLWKDSQALNAELLAANAKLKDALQDAVYEIQKLETEATDE